MVADVTIIIWLFAFPFARRTRLMMFHSDWSFSPFPPTEGWDWWWLNQNISVRLSVSLWVEIDHVWIRIRLFALPFAWRSRLMMFEWEYSCSPFPPPEGQHWWCFNPNTTGIYSLQLTVGNGNDLTNVRLFAFPSARGSRSKINQLKWGCSPSSSPEDWDWS